MNEKLEKLNSIDKKLDRIIRVIGEKALILTFI